jgi:hypothetical protein
MILTTWSLANQPTITADFSQSLQALNAAAEIDFSGVPRASTWAALSSKDNLAPSTTP